MIRGPGKGGDRFARLSSTWSGLNQPVWDLRRILGVGVTGRLPIGPAAAEYCLLEDSAVLPSAARTNS